MFLSEWREFPSAPCLAEKENDSSRLDVVEIARIYRLKSVRKKRTYFTGVLLSP